MGINKRIALHKYACCTLDNTKLPKVRERALPNKIQHECMNAEVISGKQNNETLSKNPMENAKGWRQQINDAIAVVPVTTCYIDLLALR